MNNLTAAAAVGRSVSKSLRINSQAGIFTAELVALINKNTFCGTRYLSHCCSLHGTVLLSRQLSLKYPVRNLDLEVTWRRWSPDHTIRYMFNFLYVLDWNWHKFEVRITVWAVAQTCCISQCAKYRKSGIFGYRWEQNPWTNRHETWGT